jgi:hypothetical protein
MMMTDLIQRLRERPARYSTHEDWARCPYVPNKGAADWMGIRPKLRRVKHGSKPLRYSRPSPRSLRHVIDYREQRKCEHNSALNDLKIEFDLLADLWERETRNISSPKAIINHPAIQEIIHLGEDVVPLILRRMSHHPWFWFDALVRLTKESIDPVTPSMYGDMQQMADAWLNWGADRGII